MKLRSRTGFGSINATEKIVDNAHTKANSNEVTDICSGADTRMNITLTPSEIRTLDVSSQVKGHARAHT